MNLCNYRVGTRLATGFGLLLAVAAALTIVGVIRMNQIQSNFDRVVDSDFPKIALVNKMRDAVRYQAIALRDIVLQEDVAFKKKEFKLMKEARAVYQTASGQLKALISDADTQAMLAELVVTEAAVKEAIGATIDLSLDDKHQEAGESTRERVRPAQLELGEKLGALLEQLENQSRATAAEAASAYRSAFVSMTVIALVAIALGVGIAWVITRSIVGPLNEAVNVAKKISTGDLTSRIHVSGKDETAHLMTALKEMNKSLGRIISGVKNASDSVGQNAALLSGAMDHAASQVRTQNERIMAVSAAVEQMSASIGEITHGAQGVRDASEQSRGIARENDQNVTQSMAATQRVVQAVEFSGSAIGELSNSIHKITEFTQVINSIADQTNLLALNATIEAARAGEQGRGFAVVADEVRVLSQRTTTSTSQIASMINSVKQRATEATVSMDRVKLEVAAGSRLVETTAASIRKINEAADRVSELTHHIADATREQNGATEEAARNMEHVAQLAEQSFATLKQLDQAAGKLTGTCAELRELVAQFKLS